MRAFPACLAFVTLALAGCTANLPSQQDPTSPRDPFAPLPPSTWKPHPAIGPQPTLRADSAFQAADFGFVAKAFTPPAAPRPVLFAIDGYGNAGEPTHYVRMRDGLLVGLRVYESDPTSVYGPGYLVAFASLRGSGCSAGTWELFDRTQVEDGHELIEYLAAQPWTTGRIGMIGASYSMWMAHLVAGTQPPHLVAIGGSVPGSDIYRDVAFPGGVLNDVFSVAWPAVIRQGGADIPNTLEAMLGLRPGNVPEPVEQTHDPDEVCAFNVGSRPPGNPNDNVLARIATTREDGAWMQLRNPITYAADVNVPALVFGAWQDEQIGSRGELELYWATRPYPVLHNGKVVEPFFLRYTNGYHGTGHMASRTADALPAWMDFWLRGTGNGVLDQSRVELWMGSRFLHESNEADRKFTSQAKLSLDDLPASNTTWVRWHLGDGTLTEDAPSAGGRTYAYGRPMQDWTRGDVFGYPAVGTIETRVAEHPDMLTYRSDPVSAQMLVAGPVTLTLHVETSLPDVDLYASVADVHPDGSMTYLQRGLLKTSHMAIDPTLAKWAGPSGDVLVRPYHPHTNPQPPGLGVHEVHVEIQPFAHVLHPGHRLQVQIHTPPQIDGLWGHPAARTPGPVRIHHGDGAPSSILLPVVPWERPLPAPDCGYQDGDLCVPPAPLESALGMAYPSETLADRET